MKYIEEINPGSCFVYKNKNYILTNDFKFQYNQKYNYSILIENGFGEWLPENSVIQPLDLYFIDGDKNIIPLKEPKNDNTENKNIF
jgi:hypothetical protein